MLLKLATTLILAIFICPLAGASDHRPKTIGALENQLRVELAQRKPHDLGNCYQWKGCRGDSIGNMWVATPELCARLGGKSWMDTRGQCQNITPGPLGTHRL
ncbi:MAG: hypothetical protein ACRCTY_08290 [Candidatus Adiutrix sp.]